MEENKITMEQAEEIGQRLDEAQKGTNIEKIQNLPSNQGVEENENPEKGEMKMVNVTIDPISGEQRILGYASKEATEKEPVEDVIKRLDDQDFGVSESEPITQEELEAMISNTKEANGIINEISDNFEISSDSIRTLLEVVNKVMKKENINIYQSFPDEIKKMVDKYLAKNKVAVFSEEGRRIRNFVAKSLIDEFITNITTDRAVRDFNSEIEGIFQKGYDDLADLALQYGYTPEKNKKLREKAPSIEDEEKRQKFLEALDSFDDAYNLTSLKEFAKRCKIKHFDLEKPKRYYSSFLSKYQNSSYNIHSIDIVKPILARHINTEDRVFTEKDLDAFFVCFCKQVGSMKPDVPKDHAYMYNVFYNITVIDINRGESKAISDTYLENIREVIDNLRERNHFFE